MGAKSWCDESYQTPDGGHLTFFSHQGRNTLSIYNTKLMCLSHLVAPDQLCLPSSNLMSAEMCKLLNRDFFCSYFLYWFFPLPKIYILKDQQHFKLEIFQPAPFLKHHQYQNWTLPLFQVLWDFSSNSTKHQSQFWKMGILREYEQGFELS